VSHIFFIILFCCFHLFSEISNAADVGGVSTTIHHLYQSPRALGMGNAFVAVANDYSSLYYNPAGLARREDSELNLSLDVGGSTRIHQFYSDVKEAQGTTGADSVRQKAVLNVIEETYGKTFSIRTAPVAGAYVTENWGVGVIPMDLSVEMIIHKGLGPTVNTTVYADSTVTYGYADDVYWIPHSRMSVGFAGKFVNRAYFSKSVNFIELAVDPELVKKEDLQEGYTVDGDLGFLYTPELPSEGYLSLFHLAKPTFGLVVRNIAEMGFAQSMKLVNKESKSAPEKLFRVVDIGSKWEYPAFGFISGRGVLDFRDLGHPAFNWRKGTHIGFEFDWSLTSWWKGAYRVGLNQGYFTGGLSAKFTIFNLDFATYGEDVGSYYASQENRVYLLRLNMNF
jgi:hypothetical protein